VGASLVAAIDEESDGYMRRQCEGNVSLAGVKIRATHEKVEGDLHDERGPGHEDLDGVAGVSVGQTSGRNTVGRNLKIGGKAVAH
jgi:hypothetical protein